MGYIHIFTDGVDKILSASIWFKWYGGNNAFCFYKNGALKGYIHSDEYERLRAEGKKLLMDRHFVDNLITSSAHITDEFSDFSRKISSTAWDGLILQEAANLLERCYKNYFYTEEYYTDGLEYDNASASIKKIGEFRLEFMKTCKKATELVHDIAQKIYPSLNTEFFTIEELASRNLPETYAREDAFLLMNNGKGVTLLEGNSAIDTYQTLIKPDSSVEMTSGHVLQGAGASSGVVEGEVFIISLTDRNIAGTIAQMPENAVLVAESTQPHLIVACNKASAIVTNEGGVLSHAAIIARELKIPCVVGTREATERLTNGDKVRVDGGSGKVVLLE